MADSLSLASSTLMMTTVGPDHSGTPPIQGSQQHPMGFLLLPVSPEGSLQNQLSKFAAVAPALHLQGEEAIEDKLVDAQGVGAHIRVLGALQSEAGIRNCQLSHLQHVVMPGKAGHIVIDVQNLHLNPVELQTVLHHHLQV